MSAFFGMRGTGDWATDQRPKSFREGMLYLYPNGQLPLNAMLSKMKNEKVDDPQFYWWTKTLPTQRATVTGVYTDAALSKAYTSGGVAGTVLYIKMSADDSGHFRTGHQVLLRDASDFTVDVNAKVTAVSTSGTNSYIQVKLLEADDNSAHSHDLSDADTCIIIGNINAEGATMPSAISYDPVKLYNYTQIFRTSLSITRTARRTRLRTGDQYKEAKREALELHGIEMEKAFLFGVPTEGTGDNGKPERTTEGLITNIRTNNATNGVSDFSLSSTYSGKLWVEDGGGEDWLDAMLMNLFLYGRDTKMAFCGNGALLGINKLVKAGTHYNITSTTIGYGIKVQEWITPYGTLMLKTHPLFNYETTLRYSLLAFEPENLSYRFIDDTTFYGEGGNTASSGTNSGRKDGTDEEFLTEAGLEYHHPYTAAFLNGVGQDNSV
jgi:hypothetical protein